MVTFRNNNQRRNNFRRNDRTFKVGGDRNKFNNNFSNNDSFQRKLSNRNNHNASKLVEKYNNLAREALSTGDKILSENYFQHADHFTRVLSERENQKKITGEKSLKEDANSQLKKEEKQIKDFSEEKDIQNSKIQTKVS
tara:strand:+ start:284 stop:700 length:417 start_codon:yes stop_codon:yes gene_type:complete